MSVAHRIHRWCQRLSSFRELLVPPNSPPRKATLETLERRTLMAADPIWMGGVYVESDTGSDAHGDLFYVSFIGGAEGTQLKRLTINTDQNAKGYSVGDNFFDISDSGYGADHSFAFSIENLQTADPNASVQATVSDGGMELILNFTNFKAGDLLVFSIDVDEVQQWDPNETNMTAINAGIDPITSGVEFQGSRLIGEFTAPHYEDNDGEGRFLNLYDPVVDPANLPIPKDNANGQRDRSAGTAVQLQQIPKPISLAGTVYADNNRNLNQDGGESGIANVNLALFRKNGSTFVDTGFTTRTDSQGNYRFGTELGLLPGTYQIRETQPAGYESVGAVPGSIVGVGRVGQIVVNDKDILTEIDVLLGDQHAVDLDFAEALPSSISGHVCLALPGFDCFSTAPNSKAPLADVLVELMDNTGKIVASTRTQADGTYKFDSLPAGVYTLVEHTPAEYLDGAAQAGSIGGSVADPSRITQIVLGGGVHAVNYDFCELLPASISGHVYEDIDNDGKRESGEPPLPGTVIRLFNESGSLVAQTTTDSQGFYKFAFLKPGNYRLVETTPTGYLDGLDSVGTILANPVGVVDSALDTISEILLTSGRDGINYDFGELRSASISGKVFTDRDQDCIQDSDEGPIENVLIQLLDEFNQVLAETRTDIAGNYRFDNLRPGNYTLRETQPVGYFQGGQMAGSGGGDDSTIDHIKQIQIQSGNQLVRYDFCEVPPSEIAGWVFVDPNGDCEFQPTEQSIANVRIELYNSAGQLVDATVTRADGSYSFRGLMAGEYTIREIQPAGYYQGGQKAGSGGGDASIQDVLSAIRIGAGQQLVNYNFCETLPASLTGIVFVDRDSDCIQDSGEESLANVTIELLNDRGDVINVTQTDASGRYRFENLAAGRYTIREIGPDGFFHFQQMAPAGRADTLTPFLIKDLQLTSGEQLSGLDFCERPPAKLSGYVFQDGDTILTSDGKAPNPIRPTRDGLRTADDTPIAGVVLELRSNDGTPLDGSIAIPGTYSGPIRAVTNAEGYFEFTGLQEGSYSVYQIHPTEFLDSLDTPGTTGGLAVNQEDLPSLTDADRNELFARMTNPNTDPQYDAIFEIALTWGGHSQENNFSEIKADQLYAPPPPTSDPQPRIPLGGSVFYPFQTVLQPDAPREAKRPDLPLGGVGVPYTWHLSIINAGAPRGVRTDRNVERERIVRTAQVLDVNVWTVVGMKQGRWTIVSSGPKLKTISSKGVFNIPGAKALAGDFNGDGRDEVALYVAGEWLIDVNGNGQWDREDLWSKLGDADDIPVVGDWDGDGKDDIGIFGPEWRGDRPAIEREPGIPDPANLKPTRPKNLPPSVAEAPSKERLMQRNPLNQGRGDLVDHVFSFGAREDQAFAGDFNGDGISTVGIFRNGKWRLDVDGDGKFTDQDREKSFGNSGDQAIVGDFNGDGIDEIAIVRQGQVIVDSNHNGQIDPSDEVFNMENEVDQIVVGDFDGDGRDEPALHRMSTPDDVPLQAQREGTRTE